MTTDMSDRTARTDPSGRTISIHARGHENVTGTHASTLELTSEDFLTPAGDCILAVGADTVPAAFPEAFGEACRRVEARISLSLTAHRDGDPIERVMLSGRGHPDLTLADPTSMVVRTSEYIDDRTVMIGAGAAAADLDRELIGALATGASLHAVLRVE
jgi:uncharacterized protein